MAEVKAKKTTKITVKAEKPAIKKTVKASTVSTAMPKVVKEAAMSLKVSVVGVDGVSKGSFSLPDSIFGAKPNKTLIAQAIRVYLANQRQGNASTKTRGDVAGTTKKIYRQKGTGRARHGAAKAPIFVGGGIVFGPHPHSFSLEFPKKMRKKALICALSEKAQSGMIRVVDGEFSGKTKEVVKLMKTLEFSNRGKAQKVLFVVDKNENATRAAHNIDGLELATFETLSTYEVAISRNVVFLKNAVVELEKRLLKN